MYINTYTNCTWKVRQKSEDLPSNPILDVTESKSSERGERREIGEDSVKNVYSCKISECLVDESLASCKLK